MKKNLMVRTSPATAASSQRPGRAQSDKSAAGWVRCHRGSLRTPPRSQSFLSLPRAFVSSARRQALHMGVEQSWKLHHFHYIGVGCRAGLAGEAMGEGDGVATGEIAAKTCASKRSMASRRSGWCLFTSRCLFTAERTPLTAAERPSRRCVSCALRAALLLARSRAPEARRDLCAQRLRHIEQLLQRLLGRHAAPARRLGLLRRETGARHHITHHKAHRGR